jgi:hypothetical protein
VWESKALKGAERLGQGLAHGVQALLAP